MEKSQPPGSWTAPVRHRLRVALASLAALITIATVANSARAAKGPIRVLVWAVVAEPARFTMSPELWSKDIAAFVGGNAVAFAGPNDPTVADCRAAAADYAIVAPFSLRPKLPGMANSGDRIAAQTHLVVTNCITGTTTLDRVVFLESDPPTHATDGDIDGVPEIAWAHGLPGTLAKNAVVFERVARIAQVTSPLALVDIRAGRVRVGDGLRDFAHADHSVRPSPIALTVTQVFDRYVEVMFSSNGDRPATGDLVEPLTAPTARPATPSPAPSTPVAPAQAASPQPTPSP